MEATKPLQYMCGWDRTLSVTPRAKYSATVLAGYRTTLSENDTKTEIEWYPPGQGLSGGVPSGSCPWHANISGDFEYQVYIHDITDYVGTSGVEYNLYKVRASRELDAGERIIPCLETCVRMLPLPVGMISRRWQRIAPTPHPPRPPLP